MGPQTHSHYRVLILSLWVLTWNTLHWIRKLWLLPQKVQKCPQNFALCLLVDANISHFGYFESSKLWSLWISYFDDSVIWIFPKMKDFSFDNIANKKLTSSKDFRFTTRRDSNSHPKTFLIVISDDTSHHQTPFKITVLEVM